ncbi:transcriptional regulator [Neorhizobium vignae]|jgi:predicted transcriptional regulator|uniref:HVO_A0114 family putative DNA-binding protein n=1 Tax=Neorhizobium vignae TaxID=690585 RepID=UPI00055AF8F3|nr:transcriptional regulator [Neorhizobium vignae]
MTTATIRIQRDDETVLQNAAGGFLAAWKTGKTQDHVFSFSSPEQLFTVLAPKRWTLIETLQGLGPSTYRALAAALSRDVKRVHEDTAVLIEWGLVEVNEDGRIYVPYDVIHADFDLRSVA